MKKIGVCITIISVLLFAILLHFGYHSEIFGLKALIVLTIAMFSFVGGVIILINEFLARTK